MRAITAQIGSAEPAFVNAEEPPDPEHGEVLCRTLQLGVCGTDREILLSEKPWVPQGDDHLILGHECLGRIEQVGEGVAQLEAGDLVVPVVRRARTQLDRRVDLLPPGHYVERGIAFEHGFSAPLWIDRAEHLFRVDPQIASIAVLTEPLSVAEKGINEAVVVQRGRIGEQTWRERPPRVLVTGMGPIGFAAVVACRSKGWPVTMYGRDGEHSFRAGLAVSLGADYLPADKSDLAPDDAEVDGYDLMLECTGSDEVMIRASQSLASCGVIVWVGSSRIPQAVPHNVAQMMRNGVLGNHVYLGTVNAAPRDFADALAHLKQMHQTHQNDLMSLITDRVTPDKSLWHYQHRKPQGIKTVLMYE